jgi:5-methylcytosine-specific restriction endonuclease McrBC GTP-binding regulatory subunit McrB
MSYRIDHNEPIPKLIERLKEEHREMYPKLDHVIELADSGDLKVAESILDSLSQQILRHSVEEEARIMQVIADKAQPEVEKNAEIMRHHRRIEEFIKDKLPYLKDFSQGRARQEIKDFATELKKHHQEEEEISFPLALKMAK